MKINPFAYVAPKQPVARPAENEAVKAKTVAQKPLHKNEDTITISSQGAFQAEVEALSKPIVESIEGPTDPDKLARIAEQYKNGSYYVSTEELTNTIMEKWLGK